MYLLNTTRTIRLYANLLTKVCGDCLLVAPNLINLMPPYILNRKIPLEILVQKHVNFNNLRVLGCLCFVAIKTHDELAMGA